MHTYIHTYTYTYMHAYTRAEINARAREHTDTHNLTHTNKSCQKRNQFAQKTKKMGLSERAPYLLRYDTVVGTRRTALLTRYRYTVVYGV